MNKANFQALVRNILNEEIKKRVPEMNGNGINDAKKNKTFASDPNTRDKIDKNQMLDQLVAAVKSLDKTFDVVWDDHDDLTVHGGDILKLSITPLFEDNYRIVYYPRNEDRFFFTGLSWKQVIEFVKDNLHTDSHTGVEKARDKSYRNSEDQTDSSAKGLPQNNKLTPKKVGDTSNKNKDFNKKAVTNEADLPNAYRRPVDPNSKIQSQHKVTDPVKLRKRTPDKKLVIKQS